jgi:ketosteroid isomerase-like protein
MERQMRIQQVPASRLDRPEAPARTGRPRTSSGRAPRDRRTRNERVVRAVLDAYARRQPGEVRTLFSPDAHIHVEPPVEAPGDYVGLDGALEWLGRVEAAYGADLRMTVHDVLASTNHVVVLYELNTSAGRPARRVGVYHVSRGRIHDLTVTAGPENA